MYKSPKFWYNYNVKINTDYGGKKNEKNIIRCYGGLGN